MLVPNHTRRGVAMDGQELLERGLRLGIPLWLIENELDWQENQGRRWAENMEKLDPSAVQADCSSGNRFKPDYADADYEWHVRKHERAKRLLKPTCRRQLAWFNPF